MNISKMILTYFSKPDSKAKEFETIPEWSLENALVQLEDNFPDFKKQLSNKWVLDFGCGKGYQSVAFRKNGACFVLGLDILEKNIDGAKRLAELSETDYVKFDSSLKREYWGNFDIVISQNSFEHFSNPEEMLNLMKLAIKPNGKIFVTFGPPWYAPYGAHMGFFTKIPWLNIIFDEKTVIDVRRRFRNDDAEKYEQVDGGLNKMTLSKFEKIVRKSGLQIVSKNFDCAKGLRLLGRIPFIQELFVNQVNCILMRR